VSGYLGDCSKRISVMAQNMILAITYSRESEPMGTAGPLGIAPGLAQTCFAMNGDLPDDSEFCRDGCVSHRSHGGPVTVGLADKTVNIDLGVIKSTADHVLVEYIEKPTYNYKVSMGVYVFEPSVLSLVRGAGRLDLPDLIRQLITAGQKPMTFDSQCRWLDMGRIEDYRLAGRDIRKRPRYLFAGSGFGECRRWSRFAVNWAGRNVLVTGAGGFIGSHLVEELVMRKAKVRLPCCVYNSRGSLGWLDDVARQIYDAIEVVQGDLRDGDAVLGAVREQSVVFHLGAIISIPFSYVSPSEVAAVTITGTLNV